MNDIYIESLHVKNVRFFTELNIQFNRKFNFLAGPNGCGKTSVLACISHCFGEIQDHAYSAFAEYAEVWTEVKTEDKKYRVGFNHDTILTTTYRKSNFSGFKNPAAGEGLEAITPVAFNRLKKAYILFLGAQRDIKYKELAGVSKEKSKEEATNEYFNNATKALYGDWHTDIKQWIINRYFMIDKTWASDKKKTGIILLKT
ncbi:hypothetical protein FACS189483_08590 [Spirochaetia bacterium]|nr:hypothetical protein FACS189483_08590 [Spirochaetia bacterium]